MNALSTLPSQLVHATPEQRLDKARRQLFEEGIRPTGLVGEAVIQSWMRCVGASRDPHEHVEFQPVTRSRVHSTLNRNRRLLAAAECGLAELKLSLAGTGCRALLVDATGVVVQSSQLAGNMGDHLLPALDRVGVNVAEGVIGTSAPGIVTRTGRPCMVLGGEHFFETIHPLYCAAAPIRDVTGSLVGVLDLSIERRPFGFDAESLVSQYATAIENKLMLANADDQLVLHFHTNRTLLDTPFEALAGINGEGQIVWMNEVARRYFGSVTGDAELLFGVTMGQLSNLLRRSDPSMTPLASGIAVWMRVALHARDGAPMLVPVCGTDSDQPAEVESPMATPMVTLATEVTSKLDALNREYIDTTLAACGGNVSRAARTLGVSRGLVYRHLRGQR